MARDPSTGSKLGRGLRGKRVPPIQAGLTRNYARAQTLPPHSSIGELAKTAADFSLFPLIGQRVSTTNLGRALLHRDLGGFQDTLQPPHGGAGQVNAGMAPFPIKAGGVVDTAVGKVAKPYKPRTLRVGELEAQLPKARSRITQTVIEKPADRVSAALGRSERAAKTPGVRLATAPERVAKAAGRSQRIERGRAEAVVAPQLQAIKKVKPGSPEDTANFWYAQLPRTHRNAEGLALVRAQQADELRSITSGRALEKLTEQERAVNAQLAVAQDTAERFRLLGEREQLRILKSDLPQRAQDVAASIGELDRLVAKPPPVNQAAIDAARTLGRDRQQILVDAGRLNPEKAAAREGLVARFVGLEPTGAEAYIGHRLPKPESFRGSFMPSPGVGRVASPKGVGSENRLVLARTGRLRPSLHVAAEDWRSAQVFRQANQARTDLGKLGTPFQGHVPEGHVLVNPRGRTVPPTWKTDELARFGDGYEDIPTIRKQAEEIVRGFLADTPADFERLKQEALDQGVRWDELRVVPKRLVDRYYGQFRSSAARGTPAKVYDSLVDAVATSIIFGRLGYIPKNVVQNLVMAVPHQGPFLLVNATRAGQAMADAELRPLLQAEVGFTGATGALGREAASRKLVGAVAGAASRVADDPIRMSAFFHEAAAAGVISKVRPILNEHDRTRLLKLLTDPAQRPLLNDIRSRTVDAMADFSRLTPDQSRLLRRLLVIPGWLFAGSRYPVHFALTHPLRSAVLAYLALGEPGAPDRLQVNRPLNEYFTGSSYRQGIDTPAGRIRTGSLSPVGTPWEIAQAAVGTARGKQGPFDFTTPTVFDYAQPLLASGVAIAQGEDAGRSLERLAPNFGLARDLLHPAAKATYPEDASRVGRLKRELGVVPIQVNDPQAKAGSSSDDGAGSKSIYAPGGGSGSKSIYAPSGSNSKSIYAR